MLCKIYFFVLVIYRLELWAYLKPLLCCKRYSIAEVKASLKYVNAAFHIDLAEIVQDVFIIFIQDLNSSTKSRKAKNKS